MSLLNLAGIPPVKKANKQALQVQEAIDSAVKARDQFKLLIAIPAYGNMMHIDVTKTLIDLARLGFPFDAMFLGNESLITRGRNTCASVFMDKKEYTHLLFIDADISIAAMSIIQLVGHTVREGADVHVVGAAVALKGFHPNGAPVTNIGAPLSSTAEALVEVERVGTAVFLMTRKAVEAACAVAPKYPGNPLTRGDGTAARATHYDLFRVGKEDPNNPECEYLSEDYYACKTFRELGFKIFIDQMIPTLHNGNFPFHNGAE